MPCVPGRKARGIAPGFGVSTRRLPSTSWFDPANLHTQPSWWVVRAFAVCGATAAIFQWPRRWVCLVSGVLSRGLARHTRHASIAFTMVRVCFAALVCQCESFGPLLVGLSRFGPNMRFGLDLPRARRAVQSRRVLAALGVFAPSPEGRTSSWLRSWAALALQGVYHRGPPITTGRNCVQPVLCPAE